MNKHLTCAARVPFTHLAGVVLCLLNNLMIKQASGPYDIKYTFVTRELEVWRKSDFKFPYILIELHKMDKERVS